MVGAVVLRLLQYFEKYTGVPSKEPRTGELLPFNSLGCKRVATLYVEVQVQSARPYKFALKSPAGPSRLYGLPASAAGARHAVVGFDTPWRAAQLLDIALAACACDAGESFEGRDQQYSGLYHLAQETFGSSMTKGVVKALVKAFLRVAAGS
jgi:hypothetical protein